MLSILLEGNFQFTQKFIDSTTVSFPRVVKTNMQLMDWHETMGFPVIQFVRLTTFKSEGYANFVWRSRAAFLELPGQPHYDFAIR